MSQTQPSAQEPKELFSQWFERAKQKDYAWFEQVLSDEMIFQEPYGAVLTKTEYLELMSRSSDVELQVIGWLQRMRGELLIVNGRFAGAAIIDHDDGTREHRKVVVNFTMVWAQRQGHWQALTYAGTLVPPELAESNPYPAV